MINILFYFYFFLLKGTLAVGFYFLKLYCAYSTGTVWYSMYLYAEENSSYWCPETRGHAHCTRGRQHLRLPGLIFILSLGDKEKTIQNVVIDVEKFAAISTVWPGRSPCTWRGQWLHSWRRVRRVPPCLVAFPPPAWLSDQQPSPPASWTEKRTKRFKEIVSRDFRCLQIILISPPRGWIRTMDHI